MNVAKARCVEVDCKRKRSICWQSSEEGQRNCKLKLGDGVEPCPLCVPFLPDCRDSVDYFA